MRNIRILLVEMPHMLSDIVTGIVKGQPDMEVVGDVADPASLLDAVGPAKADVVILGLRNAEFPDVCEELLRIHSKIRVLGVTVDGRRAFVYELRPQREALTEVSPEGLVEAIRSGARSRAH